MDGAFDRRLMLQTGAFGLGAMLLAACASTAPAETSVNNSTSTSSTSTSTTSTSATPTSSGRGNNATLAGELDEVGGHCGRADDYHYHIAPLHLEEVVGPENPIAYALDGFAIYGSVEPDGSPVGELDEFNGHVGADGVYHYHGTAAYPYVNGGLVGVVDVSDQVNPQATTPSFRPAGEPLRDATVTEFETLGGGSYRLEYVVDGQSGSIDYTVAEAEVSFAFTSPAGEVTTETYQR